MKKQYKYSKNAEKAKKNGDETNKANRNGYNYSGFLNKVKKYESAENVIEK